MDEERYADSDIYECKCGQNLSYAINDEGEALDGCGDLVCLDCALAYTVDMDTGALLPAAATLQRQREEIARLTAELKEARLTLAAEQGSVEGAPAEGWTYGIIDDEGGCGWRKPWRHGMIFAWGIGCYVSSSAVVTPHPGGWSRWRYDDDGELDEELEHHTDDAWTMRAAMQAADAAHPATPPTTP